MLDIERHWHLYRLYIHGHRCAFAKLYGLQTLEQEASVIVLMAVVSELELFEECLDPVSEGPLTAVMESSIHAILLFLWRVFQHFFKRCYCCLNLERIEVVEASKLAIAASELAEDHG